jgi:hypothetical protein
MTRFETPEPIAVAIDIPVGDVRIVAGDRQDAVVEVRPSDPARRADVTAAEQTRVERAPGGLMVKAARRRRSFGPFGDWGSIDVEIGLPAGSTVSGQVAMGALHAAGPLGDSRLKTSAGDIHVERAAAAVLTTGAGRIGLERAAGDAQLTTGSGAIDVGEVGGAAVIKNSNGDTRVGEVTGDLRVRAANGDIAVERAHASVVAKTANGNVRVGTAGRGSVVAETAMGDIDLGIPEGIAAWLDLDTRFGVIDNALDAAGPPEAGDETLQVRARSGYGDIAVRRASPATPWERTPPRARRPTEEDDD